MTHPTIRLIAIAAALTAFGSVHATTTGAAEAPVNPSVTGQMSVPNQDKASPASSTNRTRADVKKQTAKSKAEHAFPSGQRSTERQGMKPEAIDKSEAKTRAEVHQSAVEANRDGTTLQGQRSTKLQPKGQTQ